VQDNEIKVGGTLIWYYYVCKREVWLMGRHITADQDDTNVVLGRFFAEQSYGRDKKEIAFGHMKFDVVRKDRHGLVVAEVKKSSKHIKSAKMQLAFYLWELSQKGIKARGELLFPKEKRRELVELTDVLIDKLVKAKRDILKIIYDSIPPEAEKKQICRNCAYAEFCWS